MCGLESVSKHPCNILTWRGQTQPTIFILAEPSPLPPQLEQHPVAQVCVWDGGVHVTGGPSLLSFAPVIIAVKAEAPRSGVCKRSEIAVVKAVCNRPLATLLVLLSERRKGGKNAITRLACTLTMIGFVQWQGLQVGRACGSRQANLPASSLCRGNEGLRF